MLYEFVYCIFLKYFDIFLVKASQESLVEFGKLVVCVTVLLKDFINHTQTEQCDIRFLRVNLMREMVNWVDLLKMDIFG